MEKARHENLWFTTLTILENGKKYLSLKSCWLQLPFFETLYFLFNWWCLVSLNQMLGAKKSWKICCFFDNFTAKAAKLALKYLENILDRFRYHSIYQCKNCSKYLQNVGSRILNKWSHHVSCGLIGRQSVLRSFLNDISSHFVDRPWLQPLAARHG